MGMARARDKELKERAAEAAQAAIEAQAEAEMAAALAGRAGAWEEETPVPEPTIDDRRRQALAEHLQQLAKNKPETVAEVIKSWINQPQR
jgi:flagellar biosynthesis/type III secretory pathway M-ring protein FliF/YscJ